MEPEPESRATRQGLTDRRVLLGLSLHVCASALRPHTVGGVFAVTICLTIPSLCFFSLVPFKEAPVMKVLAPSLNRAPPQR